MSLTLITTGALTIVEDGRDIEELSKEELTELLNDDSLTSAQKILVCGTLGHEWENTDNGYPSPYAQYWTQCAYCDEEPPEYDYPDCGY